MLPVAASYTGLFTVQLVGDLATYTSLPPLRCVTQQVRGKGWVLFLSRLLLVATISASPFNVQLVGDLATYTSLPPLRCVL